MKDFETFEINCSVCTVAKCNTLCRKFVTPAERKRGAAIFSLKLSLPPQRSKQHAEQKFFAQVKRETDKQKRGEKD